MNAPYIVWMKKNIRKTQAMVFIGGLFFIFSLVYFVPWIFKDSSIRTTEPIMVNSKMSMTALEQKGFANIFISKEHDIWHDVFAKCPEAPFKELMNTKTTYRTKFTATKEDKVVSGIVCCSLYDQCLVVMDER